MNILKNIVKGVTNFLKSKGAGGKIIKVVFVGATASAIIEVKNNVVDGLGSIPEETEKQVRKMLDMLLGYDRNGDGKIDFTEYGFVQYAMLIWLVTWTYKKLSGKSLI